MRVHRKVTGGEEKKVGGGTAKTDEKKPLPARLSPSYQQLSRFSKPKNVSGNLILTSTFFVSPRAKSRGLKSNEKVETKQCFQMRHE